MNHNLAIGVDMQNDFCPGGTLAVPDGDLVIKPFNAVVNFVRQQNGTAVFTRDWHPIETNHFDAWPVHCLANSLGAEFNPNLIVQTNDIVISKGALKDEDAYSGFDGLDENGDNIEKIIENILSKFQKISIYIGGLATDYCVKETVLDALELQNKHSSKIAVFVLTDCIKAVNLNPSDGEKALQNMKANGARLITSTEVLNEHN